MMRSLLHPVSATASVLGPDENVLSNAIVGSEPYVDNGARGPPMGMRSSQRAHAARVALREAEVARASPILRSFMPTHAKLHAQRLGKAAT